MPAPALTSGDVRRLAEALRITGHYQFPDTFSGSADTATLAAAIAAETLARIAGDAANAAAIVTAAGYKGTYNIGNGVDSGAVTGLGLSYVPSQVWVTVEIPANGLVISAVVVGSPTADGFSFSLTGVTDSANYKLHYLLRQ